MRKGFLLIAILLLSAVWVVGQSTDTPVHRSTNPTGDNATKPGNADTSAASPSNPNIKDDTANTNGTMNGQTATPAGSSDTAAVKTLQGCLSGSAGNYMLKDDATGKSFVLTGKTDKLDSHIGQQVEVIGTLAPEAAGASASASPTSATAATTATDSFNVTSVKKLSDSCSSQPSNK